MEVGNLSLPEEFSQKPLVREKPATASKGDGKGNQLWKERSGEASVTDGALQKVSLWLILLFIIY